MMATVGGESKCGHARSRVEVTQAQNKKPRIASIDVQSNGVSVETASRKKAVRLDVVEEVKTRLDEIWNDASENALFIDNDGEPLWGPVVLCDKITWEDFSQWLDVYEGEVRRWIFEPLPDDDMCGRVVIYSLPSRPHEKTAGKILQMIQKRVQTAGNSVDLIDTIEVEASPRCKLGNRRGKEPDMSISPTGLVTNGVNVLDSGKGFPFPNIVIEVAYKNEPLNPHPGSQSVGFRDVIRNWLSPQTSVQVVIGIKIFTRRAPRRYRAILAVRNSPAWEVEFGDDAGNGPITLDFPVALLYHGVPLPPELANVVDLTIDLIALRNYLNTIPL